MMLLCSFFYITMIDSQLNTLNALMQLNTYMYMQTGAVSGLLEKIKSQHLEVKLSLLLWLLTLMWREWRLIFTKYLCYLFWLSILFSFFNPKKGTFFIIGVDPSCPTCLLAFLDFCFFSSVSPSSPLHTSSFTSSSFSISLFVFV